MSVVSQKKKQTKHASLHLFPCLQNYTGAVIAIIHNCKSWAPKKVASQDLKHFSFDCCVLLIFKFRVH